MSQYTPPPFAVPARGGAGEDAIEAEVIRGGQTMPRVPLEGMAAKAGSSFVLCGRAVGDDPNGLVLEHASVSRAHAVIQFGQPQNIGALGGEQAPPFRQLYIHDLGSTHGSE